MHMDVFPNKMSLQLKIREVRQKLMAQSNLTPHSDVNTPTSKLLNSLSNATVIPVCWNVKYEKGKELQDIKRRINMQVKIKFILKSLETKSTLEWNYEMSKNKQILMQTFSK